jgi:hypothetical protein
MAITKERRDLKRRLFEQPEENTLVVSLWFGYELVLALFLDNLAASKT